MVTTGLECDRGDGAATMVWNHVFVTGIARSGTTLLDKVLSRHPEIWIASQPLPLLYVEIKRAYLEATDRAFDEVSQTNPLTDMFGDRHFPIAEWLTFLAEFEVSASWLRAVFEQMGQYSGRYFAPPTSDDIFTEANSETLFGFVSRYLDLCSNRPRAGILGSKETWCEEFIPYYLDAGAAVIHLVRDPRDVVTSLHHGDGARYAGRSRPLLYVLRQWRKSVAFSLAMDGHAGFLSIRYEDLVGRPEATLKRIAEHLGVEPLSEADLSGPVRLDDGRPWVSNSSHEPSTMINSNSIGRYREFLSPATDGLVQAVCFPEMSRLGYAVDLNAGEVGAILDSERYQEPVERTELSEYVWGPGRAKEELERWRCLQTGDRRSSLFVFDRAYDELSRTIQAGDQG